MVFPSHIATPADRRTRATATGYGAGVGPGCRAARAAPLGRRSGVELAGLCHARGASGRAHKGLFVVAVAAARRFEHGGGGAFAVLVWGLCIVLLAQPTVRRLAYVCHLHGDRTLLEPITHWTAFTMM